MNDTETRVNWRELDSTTDEGRLALNIEIVKRLGWRVESTDLALFAGRKDVWDLVSPQGEREAIAKAMLVAELDAWAWAFKFSYMHGLPNAANDLNEAAGLPLPGDRVFMEMRRWDDGLTEARVIDFPVWQTHHPEYHREKSTALAWCKAWLAWYDAAHPAE